MARPIGNKLTKLTVLFFKMYLLHGFLRFNNDFIAQINRTERRQSLMDDFVPIDSRFFINRLLIFQKLINFNKNI
jgi:hypothetical protein